MKRTFIALRKPELVKLMTRLDIVMIHKGRYYITQEFVDFMKGNIEYIMKDVLYSEMRRMNPEISERMRSLLAILLVWEKGISQEDAIEAATFLQQWVTSGVCPFEYPQPGVFDD